MEALSLVLGSIVCVMEALSLVLGSIVFNKLYIYTSEADCTYMVFVISGVLALIPMAMIR